MQSCGFEEFISGSDTYLTTVRCRTSSGFIDDPDLIELFTTFYNIYSQEKSTHKKKKMLKLKMETARVIKIEKEKFFKIFNKNNGSLQ